MLVKISDETDRSFSTEKAASNWFCRGAGCSIDQIKTSWVIDSDMDLEGCADCKAVVVTVWSGNVAFVNGFVAPSSPRVLMISHCLHGHE